jgi:Na+/proline symporter
MSIGAANTFTRNVWKPFIHPQMSSQEESFLAKLVSLIVKIGALLVIFFVPTRFALDLQLLGGVWMVQIFPAMILGLYTRWFSGPALLIGWGVGMVVGTALAWGDKAWVPVHALKWDIPLIGTIDSGLGFAAYNGLTAVLANVVVAFLLSLLIRPNAPDETSPADYEDLEREESNAPPPVNNISSLGEVADIVPRRAPRRRRGCRRLPKNTCARRAAWHDRCQVTAEPSPGTAPKSRSCRRGIARQAGGCP